MLVEPFKTNHQQRRNKSQKICSRLALGKTAINILEKMCKCHDVSKPTKIRLVQAMTLINVMNGAKL